MPKEVVRPTVEEVRSWAVTVSIPQAGRCFGLGREAAYALARAGEFPVEVLRLGVRLVVTRSALLAALGVPEMVAAGAPAASAGP